MRVDLQEKLLWNGMRHGSENDLKSLYTGWYTDLLTYGISLTNDPQLSKESIDLLFINLWLNRNKLTDVDCPRAYVLTCFRRKLISLKQKQSATRCIYYSDDDLLDNEFEQSGEEHFIKVQEAEESKHRIEMLTGVLTDRQRQIVILKYIQEWSYEKIAMHLHLSLRTVYNSIHSSLKTMRSSGLVKHNDPSFHSLN